MLGSFLKMVQSPRRVNRASVTGAALYAFEAAVCMLIVVFMYQRFQLGSAMWAVVSAVLVLQPGLEQSYGASATRFASNLIGALTGAVVDRLHGHGTADVIVALALVVTFCEILRLDQGLRSACASLIIVMMSVGSEIVSQTTERRVLSVVIGCVTALLVRVAVEPVQGLLRVGGAGKPRDPAQVDEG
jgi:uncharacterized membrane protein YgaE (UPF0421/DUF939 family)